MKKAKEYPVITDGIPKELNDAEAEEVLNKIKQIKFRYDFYETQKHQLIIYMYNKIKELEKEK